jgi:DNA-binding MarR family transcriptional regulator
VTEFPRPRAASRTAEDVLALESLLTFQISVLARLLERRLARMLGERFGLAVAEYRVLAQVAMRPRATVRDIAARTFVDKAQVSRVVAVLEAQGLLRRSTPSTDRRSPEFTVTAAGRALIGRIAPIRRQQERELREYLGAEPTEALFAGARSLIALLTAPAAAPEPEVEVEPTAMQRRRAIRNERVQKSLARTEARAGAGTATGTAAGNRAGAGNRAAAGNRAGR